jgi:hypothetical protein
LPVAVGDGDFDGVEYNGDRVFIATAISAATMGVTGILTEFDS